MIKEILKIQEKKNLENRKFNIKAFQTIINNFNIQNLKIAESKKIIRKSLVFQFKNHIIKRNNFQNDN